MKLYLLAQDSNSGYDTFDSCIVCAENESEAIKITPDGYVVGEKPMYSAWAQTYESISCKYIGEAAPEIEKGIVLSSFNAG